MKCEVIFAYNNLLAVVPFSERHNSKRVRNSLVSELGSLQNQCCTPEQTSMFTELMNWVSSSTRSCPRLLCQQPLLLLFSSTDLMCFALVGLCGCQHLCLYIPHASGHKSLPQVQLEVCELFYQICLCQLPQGLQVVTNKLLKACLCIAPGCNRVT